MNDRLNAAYGFLARNHVVSLALCRDDTPSACSLMYAHRGFELFWVSDPSSTHSQIIDARAGRRAAATIAPDYDEFAQIQGLQLSGIASRVDGAAEMAGAMGLLARRYHFLSDLRDRPVALAAAMLKSRIYRFVPDRAVFIDNTLGFGNKTIFGPQELASDDLRKGGE